MDCVVNLNKWIVSESDVTESKLDSASKAKWWMFAGRVPRRNWHNFSVVGILNTLIIVPFKK